MKNGIFGLICVLSLMLLFSNAFPETKAIGSPYQVIYTILDLNGNPVIGQLPTVKIQKTSNKYWYDFSDGIFVSSNWVIQSNTLNEDTTNQFYWYTFTPSTSEIRAEQYLFVIDNADSVYKDHQIVSVDYLNINSTSTVSGIASTIMAISTTSANIDRDTNGIKDSGVWNGIEFLIKSQ